MPYEYSSFKTWHITEEGERLMLANFIAAITKETRYVDGATTTDTYLTIEGVMLDSDGKEQELPAAVVDATAFASMGWIMQSWGIRAIVQPGGQVKDHLRAAIQVHSKPEVSTIYRHIGWTKIAGKPAYLHAGGAITEKGNDTSVTVALPAELSRYNLNSDAANKIDIAQAIRNLYDLTKTAPNEVTWPLLAAAVTPLYGPTDFAVHITGRTGTFKSELTSLYQSMYGTGMDARHLPGSWSSTPNALEAQAYHAANAVFVVDDFVPHGTSWQQRSYQANADKIIRSQGNQSGRQRLTDTTKLQTAMYPRGLILSTGEDTPEGHSVRARMLILELSPGDIQPATLTTSQRNRPSYIAVTRTLIQTMAKHGIPNISERAAELRDELIEVGHSRTPSMLGRLIAAIEDYIDWTVQMKAIDNATATNYLNLARASIIAAGNKQKQYLEAADPCDIFVQAFRQILAAGLGHLRTTNGGIPRNAEALGWVQEGGSDEIPMWKSRGPTIGWILWDDGEIAIEANAGYNAIKKVAGAELTFTKQTMMKRLKDEGLLTRTDENRQRNTVRLTAERASRHVIAMSISTLLDTQENPQ